jgi:hypothetical protein
MIRFLFVFCLLGIFVQCRKKDDVSPTSSIIEPDAMTVYSFDDIVTVKGQVTDDVALKSFKIQLIGIDGSATDFSYEYEVSGNSHNFSKSFTLDDRHMPSGQYIIKLVAIDDADNWKSSYKEITYHELPLELLDIYLVSKVNSFTYDLSKVAASATQSVYTFSGDFQDMLANSYWEQLMFSGGSNGNLISFDPLNLVFNWEKTPVVTSQPYFNKMYQLQSDQSVYVAQGNNTAVSYDKSGSIQRTLSMITPKQAFAISEESEYVLVEEQAIGQSVLSVYYKSTGSLKHQLNLNGQIVKMLPKDDNEIYLITKSGTQSYLYVYYVADNYTYEPHAIDVGQTYDACSVDGNEIFISHDNGIYKYSYDINSMINTISYTANQLEYDFLNDRIVASQGSELKFYDRMGNPGGTVTHSSSIDKFVLYYNK